MEKVGKMLEKNRGKNCKLSKIFVTFASKNSIFFFGIFQKIAKKMAFSGIFFQKFFKNWDFSGEKMSKFCEKINSLGNYIDF